MVAGNATQLASFYEFHAIKTVLQCVHFLVIYKLYSPRCSSALWNTPINMMPQKFYKVIHSSFLICNVIYLINFFFWFKVFICCSKSLVLLYLDLLSNRNYNFFLFIWYIIFLCFIISCSYVNFSACTFKPARR
jgi:hypothetical protein